MWWNNTSTKNVQIPLLHINKRISNNHTHHCVDEDRQRTLKTH